MLAWLIEDVASPYGGVATLHWAVPDDPDDHAMDKFNTTELQVRLESAEDQLGAVLWNSNPAALAYLHTHVFGLPPVSSESALSSSAPSPPLAGKVVVELGAGVGCLGIALAMGGARVAVTDMKELLPLMAHNVKLNSKRIQSRSQGEGHCAAMQWKWGPTATTNVHKQLQRAFAKSGKTTPAVTDAALRAAVGPVMANMAEELEKPSASLVECGTALRAAASLPAGKLVAPAAAVPCHYVILCDALYGNPRDWPSLLYTLTELLATNPDECEIVNFCEQRVDDVEGAFLRLLDEENSRVYVPAAQREADGGGDPLWSAVVESAARCCPAASSSSHSADGEKKIVVSSGATGSSAAAVEQHKAREAAAAALLNYVLWQRRGAYRWSYTTEVVAEAQSELNMTIRATRIRWAKVGPDTAAPSRRRHREAEESAEAQSRDFDPSAASDVRKKQKR